MSVSLCSLLWWSTSAAASGAACAGEEEKERKERRRREGEGEEGKERERRGSRGRGRGDKTWRLYTNQWWRSCNPLPRKQCHTMMSPCYLFVRKVISMQDHPPRMGHSLTPKTTPKTTPTRKGVYFHCTCWWFGSEDTVLFINLPTSFFCNCNREQPPVTSIPLFSLYPQLPRKQLLSTHTQFLSDNLVLLERWTSRGTTISTCCKQGTCAHEHFLC